MSMEKEVDVIDVDALVELYSSTLTGIDRQLLLHAAALTSKHTLAIWKNARLELRGYTIKAVITSGKKENEFLVDIEDNKVQARCTKKGCTMQFREDILPKVQSIIRLLHVIGLVAVIWHRYNKS